MPSATTIPELDRFERAEVFNLRALQKLRGSEAIAALNKAIYRQPLEPSYIYHRAEAELRSGDFVACLEDMNTAAQMTESSPFLLKRLSIIEVAYGRICLEESRFETALAYLNHAKPTFPDQCYVNLVCCMAYLGMKSYEKALSCIDSCFLSQPDHIELHILRCKIFLEKEMYEPVKEELMMISKSPMRHHPEMARLMQQVKDKADGLRDQSKERFRRNQFERALDLLNQAIKINHNEGYIQDRAAIYRRMGQYESALQDLLSILESQDPDVIRELSEIYHEFGSKFYKKDNFKKAIELFNQSLSYRENVDIHLKRGLSYFKCQQWNEALQDLLAYLPNDPENMEVKVCISKVYIDEAEEYRTNEKLELALEYFEKALALIKTNLIARLGRARCLIRLHRVDEGLEDLRLVLEGDPQNPVARRIYAQLQRDDDSKPLAGLIGISLSK